MTDKIEIICPAGNLSALQVAVDEGADSVYIGFNNQTNARNFPGLNFSYEEMKEAVKYAHSKQAKIFVAINTYAEAGKQSLWHEAIGNSYNLGADAVILADIGLLEYAKENFPDLRLHLSVQAAASTAQSIDFYHQMFDIKRVVLPRVLTVDEIKSLNNQVAVETEVFAFGGMCPMAEGRCSLSSYITGKSPNKNGVCSPASHVSYIKQDEQISATLGGYVINRYGADEEAGYPTLCKGLFEANGNKTNIFEDSVSLNVAEILPDIINAGVKALKIEGRQRGKAYIRDIVRYFRDVVDSHYSNKQASSMDISKHSEGQKTTAGAYKKKWR